MVPARNTRIPRLVRDYALAIAFWLSVSVLVAWQMYGFERLLSKPVVLHDLLLVYGARYLTVAILTPPIFYLVERWPVTGAVVRRTARSEEHTSELQSRVDIVCRLLLEKKNCSIVIGNREVRKHMLRTLD